MSLGKWLFKKAENYLLKPVIASPDYLSDFSRICQEVQPADVLLIQGRNRISRMVQRITQSPWSHSALNIGHLHTVDDPKLREYILHHYKGSLSEQLLIETMIGKGTIIVPISKYNKEHIRLCRPTGLTHHDAKKVIDYAVNTIGSRYDIRHFIDLGRFILSSRFIPRRWHSTLFTDSGDKVQQDICSAMLARAFACVKFPILPLIRENDQQKLEMIYRNSKLYTPRDFDFSPYFDIIKYPMMPVAGFVYRNLPWDDELMSNDDQGVSKREVSKSDPDS